MTLPGSICRLMDAEKVTVLLAHKCAALTCQQSSDKVDVCTGSYTQVFLNIQLDIWNSYVGKGFLQLHAVPSILFTLDLDPPRSIQHRRRMEIQDLLKQKNCIQATFKKDQKSKLFTKASPVSDSEISRGAGLREPDRMRTYAFQDNKKGQFSHQSDIAKPHPLNAPFMTCLLKVGFFLTRSPFDLSRNKSPMQRTPVRIC